MPRDRKVSIDFWTWEAVIDCPLRARLLFIGLQNFADARGVQPLRPRAIRLQIFPGDEIDDDVVRATIDELLARKLLRRYEVEGNEYIAVVDWHLLHRVGERARRRWPADPNIPVPAPTPPLPDPVPADATEHVPPAAPASEIAAPAPLAEPERWRRMIKNLLRQYWPRHALIELMDDDAADRWAAKWIAQGCDFKRDIVPVVRDFCALKPFCGPPVGFQELDEHVGRNRARRAANDDNTRPIVSEDDRTTSWGQDQLRLK